MRRFVVLLPLLAALVGCATLHQAQLDEIDASRGRLEPFELHVSEVGVNVKEAGELASAATRSRGPSQLANVVALFQTGPKTGNVVFDDDFADVIAAKILERCPSGRVTGLMSLRESTKYYAVSGEYVTVRGYCVVD
jgi:hypothetical protein